LYLIWCLAVGLQWEKLGIGPVLWSIAIPLALWTAAMFVLQPLRRKPRKLL
jgi:hypothetical protein